MAIVIFVILTATVGAGLTLGFFYLRGVRKPVLMGVHLLLGAGALVAMAVLVYLKPDGDGMNVGSMGTVILSLLSAAVLTGLIGGLLRKKPQVSELVLFSHALIGLTVFALFCIWAFQT